MDLARYGPLAIGALGALVLVGLSLGRKRVPIRSAALFVGAFIVFVGADLVTGQAITNLRDTWVSAAAILVFLTVVVIDLVVLIRRIPNATR